MVEAMCYYCTKRSQMTCPRCERRICPRHTFGRRSEVCIRCGPP